MSPPRRAGADGKRLRRIGIVALARRLAIALWRYLEHGLIPTGRSSNPSAGSLVVHSTERCIVRIEGQRARSVGGSLASDRPQRWGALVTGVGTQRFARMGYVVTGLVPARIEVRPSNGLEALDTPTLPAVYPRGAVTDIQLAYKTDLDVTHTLKEASPT